MIAILCCTCFLVVFALVVLLIVLWLHKNMEVEKKKVYCEDCIHCRGNSIGGYDCHYIGHAGRRETPYSITYYYCPIKNFNKKNNCGAFEPNSRKRDLDLNTSP